MTNEEILRKARRHEENAKRRDKNSYLHGWHIGSSQAYYNMLKHQMEWADYVKLTGIKND